MNHPSTLQKTRPPTARGQRTRQKLLAAAEVVFGEKGYEHASIADLTRQAEVALGTFYVYFPDKQSLFVEVVDSLGARLRRLISESVAGLEDRLEVERAGLEAFFRFAAEHRNLYRLVRQAEYVDEACFRRYYTTLAEAYARGLRVAMREGQVRAMDAEALAWCLMGIGDFLGMRWVLWEGERGWKRGLDTAMNFIRHGMDPRGPEAVSTPSRGRVSRSSHSRKRS